MSSEDSPMAPEPISSMIIESSPTELQSKLGFSDMSQTSLDPFVKETKQKVKKNTKNPFEDPNVPKFRFNETTGKAELLPNELPVSFPQCDTDVYSPDTPVQPCDPYYELLQDVALHQNGALDPVAIQYMGYDCTYDAQSNVTLPQQVEIQDNLEDVIPSQIDADSLESFVLKLEAELQKQNAGLMPPPPTPALNLAPNLAIMTAPDLDAAPTSASNRFQSSLSSHQKKMIKDRLQKIEEKKAMRKRKREAVTSINFGQLAKHQNNTFRNRIMEAHFSKQKKVHKAGKQTQTMQERGEMSAFSQQDLDNIPQYPRSSSTYTNVTKTERKWCAKCGLFYQDRYLKNVRRRVKKSQLNLADLEPTIQYLLRYFVDGLLHKLGHKDEDFSGDPEKMSKKPLITNVSDDDKKEQIAMIKEKETELLATYPVLGMTDTSGFMDMVSDLPKRRYRGKIGCDINYALRGLQKAIRCVLPKYKRAIFAVFAIAIGCDMEKLKEQAKEQMITIFGPRQLMLCSLPAYEVVTPETREIFQKQNSKGELKDTSDNDDEDLENFWDPVDIW